MCAAAPEVRQRAFGRSGVRPFTRTRLPSLLYEHLLFSLGMRPALPLELQNSFLHLALPVPTITIVTTFNNGSLGSGIDEERSEMR